MIVWIYTISFYREDCEYRHKDLIDTLTEVFYSEDSAEKWKKDFEDEKNLQYISDYKLCGWYNINNYISSIERKEIMNY